MASTSLSFPVCFRRNRPALRISSGFGRRLNMRYEFMPEPAYTPMEPGNRSGLQPACSRASHAHSQKDAMLRIHDGRIPRAEAEERRVEPVEIFQDGRRFDVGRISQGESDRLRPEEALRR